MGAESNNGSEALQRRIGVLESEIGARRECEEELRKSEERFRLLVEHARDIVYKYRFTPSRGVEYVSPVVFQITGHTPGEFYADPDLALEMAHPQDRAVLEAYVRDGEFGRPLVMRCRHKDGHTLWIEHRCLPIYDRSGTLAAIEGIAREVSESRRVLRNLERHNDRLQEEVSRRRHAEELVRDFSSKTVRHQEEERRRVARELHDGVNQLLCAVGFGLDAAAREFGNPDSDALRSLEHTRQLLDSSIGEIRRISHNLRPGLLDDLGLAPALRSLGEEFETRTGIPVALDMSEAVVELPFEVKTTVYRIVQEALNMVGGEGGKVQIALAMTSDARLVVAEIRDGGRGFGGSPVEAAPFESMSERASMVGGALDIETAADGATKLELRFPARSDEVAENES